MSIDNNKKVKKSALLQNTVDVHSLFDCELLITTVLNEVWSKFYITFTQDAIKVYSKRSLDVDEYELMYTISYTQITNIQREPERNTRLYIDTRSTTLGNVGYYMFSFDPLNYKVCSEELLSRYSKVKVKNNLGETLSM